MFVPVTSKSGEKLMPTRPNKAGMLIKKRLATPYWSNGIFCIRLNYDTEAYKQEIAVGIDPGSKKEGFTVKSEAHTYLNVQADAHNKVSKKVDKRRELRRGRRSRKCPNRKNRTNRLANRERIPAGTRVKWDWKLRILDWLSKLYPTLIGLTQPPLRGFCLGISSGFETPPAVRRTFVIMEKCVNPI